MNKPITSIQSYLDQLAAELKGGDPALIMDAINDASEFLYLEQKTIREAQAEMGETEALAAAVAKFGTPHEVAEAFLDTETRVKQAFALRGFRLKGRLGNRFFGVFTDPSAYTALLYMLLSLVTGLAAMVYIIYGLAISIPLALLTIGLPLAILFLGSVRALALVECRLVETLLHKRMPRRPVFSQIEGNLPARLLATCKELHTWKTMGYLLLMGPLGCIYFITATVFVGTILELLVEPLYPGFSDIFRFLEIQPPWWWLVFLIPLAFLVLTLLLHLAKVIGGMHARFAKYMLVGRTKPTSP